MNPRPAPRRRPPGPPVPRLRWGWLEWFVISQTAMPALLFLPGASLIRPYLRVGAYLVGPAAWAMLSWRGGVKGAPTGDTFPARPWLIGCMIWLGLSLFHPNTFSPLTAIGQATLYVAVLSPAFWAPRALAEPRQLGRIMAILFVCNALSAGLGVAQVLRPGTGDRPGPFDPPEIPALSNKFAGVDLMFETDDGRKILRPCGLTDTPGSAAPAGAVVALIGLCMAVRPLALWKRVAAGGMAFVGVAAIYYSQARAPLVMLVICLVVLTGLFAYQRRYGQAAGLITGGVLAIVGALAWVARSIGGQVFDRFGALLGGDPGSFFYKSRGVFVEDALNRIIWDHPLGYGMGWWGMIHGTFGDHSKISPVWVEVMIAGWVIDGGFPLLFLYGAAVLVAMYDTTRVALTSRDPELAFWAAVVVALNLSIVANCLSFIAFLAPIGLQFWLLAAVVHAADRQVRGAAGGGGGGGGGKVAVATSTGRKAPVR